CSCGAAPGVAERDGPLSGADGPLGGLYHGEGGAVPRTPQTAAATGSRGGSVSARQLPDCRIPPGPPPARPCRGAPLPRPQGTASWSTSDSTPSGSTTRSSRCTSPSCSVW